MFSKEDVFIQVKEIETPTKTPSPTKREEAFFSEYNGKTTNTHTTKPKPKEKKKKKKTTTFRTGFRN